MEPHNSGDSLLELWDLQQGWIPFIDAYLTEASEYKLRYKGTDIDVRIQGIPLPFYPEQGFYYATMITPFQSGSVKMTMNGEEFETYIYPDERKLTEEQFHLMLQEILEESNSCFQISGLETNVTASGRNHDITWTQWSYIDQSFYKLKQIFSRIQEQPLRLLKKFPIMMKREKVRHSEQLTLQWVDRNGKGKVIPSNVQNVKTFETRNIYENQVLKQQLLDLYRLLRKYEKEEEVAQKAGKYRAVAERWLNSPFLKEISENKGSYTITQKFRKQPVYRLWYQWFDRLYKHNREEIGFDYSISLKNTFQLYEMWCFMKIVKILRESDYVLDTSGLFQTIRDGIFLDLAENKESQIKLQDQLVLYYQRTYQSNSKPFHTYSQKMIPDIVIEGENDIIIFDPKYRVPDNVGTALGEMHKYRDGIIHRDNLKRVVKEVYILTPTKVEQVEGMRFFHDDFHKKYFMGAVQAIPGSDDRYLREKILASLEKLCEN